MKKNRYPASKESDLPAGRQGGESSKGFAFAGGGGDASPYTREINAVPKPAAGPVALLIGTRKGAFILRSDKKRQTWKLSDPIFLGHIVHHLVMDPRDGRTLLMAARTGHLGPTTFRSTDFGRNWKEAKKPPAFPKIGR